MRVLVVTKLFPNRLEPHASPFNLQQFAALSRRCQVHVLATIAWFPGAAALLPEAARRKGVPASEHLGGMLVRHPRVLYIPKVPVASGPLYAASLLGAVAPYRGRVDVVLGSFAYPDGWAALTLGRLLGVPVVIKVHGSDINVLAQRPSVRGHLRFALSRAAAVVATSRALAEAAIDAGAPGKRTHVVMNGVDRAQFFPRDRQACREVLGYGADTSPWVLYVGNLKRPKGVLGLIEAFGRLRHPEARLVVVGGGEAEAQAKRAGQTLAVTFAGPRPPHEIATWMGACNVLALPSWAEGTPNVVMEALSCGRRVVASNVGGIPDVLNHPELGEMVPPRDVPALAAALQRMLSQPYDPARVAGSVSFGSWDDSARALEAVLEQALLQQPRKRVVAPVSAA